MGGSPPHLLSALGFPLPGGLRAKGSQGRPCLDSLVLGFFGATMKDILTSFALTLIIVGFAILVAYVLRS